MIDEISMVTGVTVAMIDARIRHALCRPDVPFGGLLLSVDLALMVVFLCFWKYAVPRITLSRVHSDDFDFRVSAHVVFAGDFFQLPPPDKLRWASLRQNGAVLLSNAFHLLNFLLCSAAPV